MAEREPGLYWVRKAADQPMTVARWVGLDRRWFAIGYEEPYEDHEFVEIGERVERLTAAEIAGPEGILAYDLTKPALQVQWQLSAADQEVIGYLQKRLRAQAIIESRARLEDGNYLESTHFMRWPEPQPITDAQKTGERLLVWYAPDPEAKYGANPGDDPARENGWQTAWWDGEGWRVGGEGVDDSLFLEERRVTHYLPLPPDVKP